MRRRYRFDPDLDALVEIGGNYFDERPKGPNLIKDDLPGGVMGMRSMADGKMYDSKSRYYRSVRAVGAEIVGNDTKPVGRPAPNAAEYIREVVTAREQIAGNHNDTRGWLRQHNERAEWSRRNGR